MLRQFDPTVTAAALEAALESSPATVTDARSGRSYPRLDCSVALAALGGVAPEGCSSSAECADADPCTDDVCLPSGECDNVPGQCATETFGTGFGTVTLETPFRILPISTPGVDVAWQPITGMGTPSDGTGPDGDHTPPGSEFPTYLYVEASAAGQPNAAVNGNPNKTAIIESPCVDLRDATSASFSYFLHMEGVNTPAASVFLEADRGCDGSFDSQLLPPRSGPATGTEQNEYLLQAASVDQFAGNLVRVRIRAVTGDGFASDIAIDDLLFQVGAGNDCNVSGCPSDGLFCTTEVCQSNGACSTTPTDCGSLLCSEELDACVECTIDFDCPAGQTCDPMQNTCVEPDGGSVSARASYLETGGSATTPDAFSVTNTGSQRLSTVTIDLRSSAGGAVFDPVGVTFAVTGGDDVGFDGAFSLDGSQQLRLRFSGFDPGESFLFQSDLDDPAGGFTVGSEVAGATLTVRGSDGSTATGAFAADPTNANRALGDATGGSDQPECVTAADCTPDGLFCTQEICTAAGTCDTQPRCSDTCDENLDMCVDDNAGALARAAYLETGGTATTRDSLSVTNDSGGAITQVVIDLSTSAGGAVFDPNNVQFTVVPGDDVGFVTGSFPSDQVLTLQFAGFDQGETFLLQGDLDDAGGGFTTGADVAGATLTVTRASGAVSASFFADPSDANQALAEAGN